MNPAKQPSLLVVEDEQIVAQELSETLEELGYRVLGVAGTADDAIRLAQLSRPDLVLLDVRLRGARDGVETGGTLRRQFAVPIVYLTASGDLETFARAQITSPSAYLAKPVKPADLRAAIEVSLRRAERDRVLESQRTWLWTTLRSITDGVVSTDRDGVVSYMNPVAERFTGTSLDAAAGRPLIELISLLDESTRAPVESPIRQAIDSGLPTGFVNGILLSRGQEETHVSYCASPIEADTDSEQALGAILVLRDASEERRLRQNLELNDRLASLGTLAAGVAHEVNNPLSFIIGNQDFALRRLQELLADANRLGVELPDGFATELHEVQQALRDAQTGADRVRSIVAELKKLGRPTAAARSRLDLKTVLDSALNMTAAQLSDKARVVREFGECPEVYGDDTRLIQVFVNLLLNAAHAIAPGAADSNEVRVVTATSTDGGAQIEIRDSGCGISPDTLPHIFEPFFTTRGLETGTGLGLSISHNIIASHGGNLRVESKPGQGSSFRVHLPAAPRRSNSAPPSLSLLPRGERQARLLVIDDERILLDALARALDGIYDVCTVTSAEHAFRLLEREASYDLVLCDLMMPSMTGMDFYRLLESRLPAVARRSLFMTGGAFTPLAQEFVQNTQRPLLGKPFSNQELLQFLDSGLQSFGYAPAMRESSSSDKSKSE